MRITDTFWISGFPGEDEAGKYLEVGIGLRGSLEAEIRLSLLPEDAARLGALLSAEQSVGIFCGANQEYFIYFCWQSDNTFKFVLDFLTKHSMNITLTREQLNKLGKFFSEISWPS